MKVIIENRLGLDFVFDLLQDKELTPPFLHANIDKKQYSIKLSQKAFFITVEIDNHIVAYAAYYLNDISKVLFITLITIDQYFRRLGVGRKILRLLATYYEDKYKYIDLEVDKINISAYDFYIKNGFIELSSNNEKTQLRVEIDNFLKKK